MRLTNYIYLLVNTIIGLAAQFAMVEVRIFGAYVVCFPYLLPILLLPMLVPSMLSMLVAFGLGMLVDMMYNTVGIQAFAAVTVAFMRQLLINTYTAHSIQEVQIYPRPLHMGWSWYILYLLPLLLIHHVIVFGFEMGIWMFKMRSLLILLQGWLTSAVFFISTELIVTLVRKR